MSLIVPTSQSFADSSPTEGGGLDRKYVLAQFHSDADFDWVNRLRAELATQELKYTVFRHKRPRLKKNKDLWRKVTNGFGQASIIIVDPEPTIRAIRTYFDKEKITPEDGATDRAIVDACATAIIRETPIAYLPHQLAKTIDWSDYRVLGTLDEFTPKTIRERIGGGLREAKIFAARAHAVFDLKSMDSSTASTRDVFTSPLSNVLLTEFLSTTRYFDEEDQDSIAVLNDVSDQIARVVMNASVELASDFPLASEVDSKEVDEIQAADIAAGYARELYDMTGDPRDLGATFERVWINGTRVK